MECFAHKVIPAARSPVFAGMLSHKMQKSLTNSVELGDVDAVVLKETLSYMYTGRVNNKIMKYRGAKRSAQKYES